MSQSTIKGDVKSFLSRHVRGVDVKDSDDIFTMGLVNSMFAMQLVEFIEKRFEVEIGPDDLEMDNFRSIDAIAALVERKSSGDGARANAEGA
ncbi:phosphopantetheine-binding protein [Polyangium sp. 6x1]|uniref:acyl carrier protein n=1 Tax=Polyangium sp. 6x1 TaxID=3042689 RepID=UPI0024829B66|nr:phosphopantetheine-binding protein [Polyangium sp. 6x1]MDI1443047.1 phosphopantetheine-binding protein [Polyangium sp. 6x1]